MQMQEFDLDEYMDGGIGGAEPLNFDLDINASSTSHFTTPNHFVSASSRAPTFYQPSNVRPSIEIDANSLGPYDQTTLAAATDVGAGPLPQSHGISSTGSTVTDFTKRRNWSQRVLEELKDFLHILSPDGRLLYVSPSVTILTGHESQDIVGKLISDYIHHDDTNVFVREFNESIASGNPLRFFYRFRRKDGTYAIFEAHGHPHLTSEAASFGQNAGASFCRGFFMMARPYPTKNAALLDSFLEHKIENERLRKRIADLKREEHDDLEGQQQQWLDQKASGSAVHSQSPYPQMQHVEGNISRAYDGIPLPADPSVSNNALTRQNLDEALAESGPDDMIDKMARYQGSSHFETIEKLTGLRYRDGERSQGISTGAASPALLRGDAGIAMHFDKDGKPQPSSGYGTRTYDDFQGGDRKKKIKLADEYVCTDCGTLDSPEWRKGPSGPKTLCNACGLRWAKKEKKRTGPLNDVANGQSITDGSVPPTGENRMMLQGPT